MRGVRARPFRVAARRSAWPSSRGPRACQRVVALPLSSPPRGCAPLACLLLARSGRHGRGRPARPRVLQLVGRATHRHATLLRACERLQRKAVLATERVVVARGLVALAPSRARGGVSAQAVWYSSCRAGSPSCVLPVPGGAASLRGLCYSRAHACVGVRVCAVNGASMLLSPHVQSESAQALCGSGRLRRYTAAACACVESAVVVPCPERDSGGGAAGLGHACGLRAVLGAAVSSSSMQRRSGRVVACNAGSPSAPARQSRARSGSRRQRREGIGAVRGGNVPSLPRHCGRKRRRRDTRGCSAGARASASAAAIVARWRRGGSECTCMHTPSQRNLRLRA